MTSMVIAKNIVKTFGSKIALNTISFEIKEGEIFGFLGPSGSGENNDDQYSYRTTASRQWKHSIVGKRFSESKSDRFRKNRNG